MVWEGSQLLKLQDLSGFGISKDLLGGCKAPGIQRFPLFCIHSSLECLSTIANFLLNSLLLGSRLADHFSEQC